MIADNKTKEYASVWELIAQSNTEEAIQASIFDETGLTQTQIKFCKLFQYRYNWIKKTDSNWFTLKGKKNQLSHQDLVSSHADKDTLIGVRFGNKTNYLMLDLDYKGGFATEEAIKDIRFALEDVGLNKSFIIQSSFSQGIHLYFPFSIQVHSWRLAALVTEVLKKNNLKVEPGKIEIFPNFRSYNCDHNGHRLPLQQGSYLLDDNFLPYSNNLEDFVDAWFWCVDGQDYEALAKAVDGTSIGNHLHSLEKGIPKTYTASVSAILSENHSQNLTPKQLKYKKDLEAVLEQGFTGKDQTQEIIKAAIKYGLIFEGLTNFDKLFEYALQRVTKASGYMQYSAHFKTIKKDIKDWAASTLRSNRYYPLNSKPDTIVKGESQNDTKKKASRMAIAEAVEKLILEGKPVSSRAIASLAGLNKRTVDKHKDLWIEVTTDLRKAK